MLLALWPIARVVRGRYERHSNESGRRGLAPHKGAGSYSLTRGKTLYSQVNDSLVIATECARDPTCEMLHYTQHAIPYLVCRSVRHFVRNQLTEDTNHISDVVCIRSYLSCSVQSCVYFIV